MEEKGDGIGGHVHQGNVLGVSEAIDEVGELLVRENTPRKGEYERMKKGRRRREEWRIWAGGGDREEAKGEEREDRRLYRLPITPDSSSWRRGVFFTSPVASAPPLIWSMYASISLEEIVEGVEEWV